MPKPKENNPPRSIVKIRTKVRHVVTKHDRKHASNFEFSGINFGRDLKTRRNQFGPVTPVAVVDKTPPTHCASVAAMASDPLPGSRLRLRTLLQVPLHGLCPVPDWTDDEGQE